MLVSSKFKENIFVSSMMLEVSHEKDITSFISIAEQHFVITQQIWMCYYT